MPTPTLCPPRDWDGSVTGWCSESGSTSVLSLYTRKCNSLPWYVPLPVFLHEPPHFPFFLGFLFVLLMVGLKLKFLFFFILWWYDWLDSTQSILDRVGSFQIWLRNTWIQPNSICTILIGSDNGFGPDNRFD